MGSASGQTVNAEWWRTIDEFNAGAYAPDPASRQLVPLGAGATDAADADGDQNAVPPNAAPEAPEQHTSPTDTPADGTILEPAARAGQGIGRRVVRLNRAAGRVPTPGGIAPLAFILIVLLWAIVPVGAEGATRLKLLWLVLTGQAGMPGVRYSGGTPIAGGGSSGPCGPRPDPNNYPHGAVDPGYIKDFGLWSACVAAHAGTGIVGGALSSAQPANAGSGPAAAVNPDGPLMRYGVGLGGYGGGLGGGGFQLPSMEYGSSNGRGGGY